jgi:MFS family permease
VGLFFFSVIALIASQVTTLPQALIAMGAVGLTNGVWTALAVPLLVDLVPQERAAEMTGLGSAVWSLSQPIGSVIAGVLIVSAGSYRIPFVGAALFVFLSFTVLLFVRAPSVRRT